jgi:L-lactate dehydrogenase complex protein LldG
MSARARPPERGARQSPERAQPANRARDNILGRVRQALGKTGPDATAREAALAHIATHPIGPRPALPADLRQRFLENAAKLESSVDQLARREEIPRAVARYLTGIGVAPRAAGWPEFADLPWGEAGVEVAIRPTQGQDPVGLTSVFCAIAETGTVVVLAGPEAPTGTLLLPDTHIAVVDGSRIVASMEDAFVLIRKERGSLPRAVNMVSGPSRTGDIEQTIVLGAHGPFRVHLLIVG